MVRLLISKMYKDQHEKKYLNVKRIPCLIFEIVQEFISEGGCFKGFQRNSEEYLVFTRGQLLHLLP